MNTVRTGQNLSLIAIWHGRGNCSKSSGFIINSKCNRHQICNDGLYLTCFLNSKINSMSVDLPKNTKIPTTFSTILWQFIPFKINPQTEQKSPQPYHLSFLEAQGTSKLWKGHDLLVSYLQMVFISYFKIIKGTSINP